MPSVDRSASRPAAPSGLASEGADVAVVASAPGLRHLAIFLADLRGGGAERMMVALANGIAARGVRVDLLVADPVGPYLEEVAASVRLRPLRTGGVARALLPLVRYLRRERPEVLISTLAHANVAALAARALAGTGVPVIVREANTPTGRAASWSSPKTRLAAALMRASYRWADGVVAVSDGVAEALRADMRVPADKIATLYNPVVTPELASLAAAEPDHPWLRQRTDDSPVVLGVGSLTPRKDFPTLVRAFAEVRRRRPARLVILGEGPERGTLERLAHELGIVDAVALPGFHPNPFAYLARADVFVSSSQREGLPGALIQALACGCPAVATDCASGPAEVLDGGALGELVPVGDATAMAAAIERTLARPPERERLREASRKYDADVILDRYLAYFGVMARGRSRASARPG